MKGVGTAGPMGPTSCFTGGGTFGALGALLRTALGLDDGAGMSIDRLFDGRGSVVVLAAADLPMEPAAPDEPDPAEPPVICTSSSSGMTVGCSDPAVAGRVAKGSLADGRGQIIGECLERSFQQPSLGLDQHLGPLEE